MVKNMECGSVIDDFQMTIDETGKELTNMVTPSVKLKATALKLPNRWGEGERLIELLEKGKGEIR